MTKENALKILNTLYNRFGSPTESTMTVGWAFTGKAIWDAIRELETEVAECDICHKVLPIVDVKCMCFPPTYWCKRCTLEREARDFPNSTMKVTV
jgi:hypothetical protein